MTDSWLDDPKEYWRVANVDAGLASRHMKEFQKMLDKSVIRGDIYLDWYSLEPPLEQNTFFEGDH